VSQITNHCSSCYHNQLLQKKHRSLSTTSRVILLTDKQTDNKTSGRWNAYFPWKSKTAYDKRPLEQRATGQTKIVTASPDWSRGALSGGNERVFLTQRNAAELWGDSCHCSVAASCCCPSVLPDTRYTGLQIVHCITCKPMLQCTWSTACIGLSLLSIAMWRLNFCITAIVLPGLLAVSTTHQAVMLILVLVLVLAGPVLDKSYSLI